MGQKKPIIVIDLDGTILDITERWYVLHKDLAQFFGFDPLKKKEYLSFKRSHISERGILKKNCVSSYTIDRYVKKRLTYIESKKYLAYDKPKKRVINTLKVLTKRFSLLLVTKRKYKKRCLEQLKQLAIDSFFDKIIITEGVSKQNFFKRHMPKAKMKILKQRLKIH